MPYLPNEFPNQLFRFPVGILVGSINSVDPSVPCRLYDRKCFVLSQNPGLKADIPCVEIVVGPGGKLTFHSGEP